jgi:hypothetical protein
LKSTADLRVASALSTVALLASSLNFSAVPVTLTPSEANDGVTISSDAKASNHATDFCIVLARLPSLSNTNRATFNVVPVMTASRR